MRGWHEWGRRRLFLGLPVLLPLALAGCGSSPPTPNRSAVADANATAAAIVAHANATASAIAAVPSATTVPSATAVPTALMSGAAGTETPTPAGYPNHEPAAPPTNTATATTVPTAAPVTAAAAGPWQIAARGVQVAAASRRPGWSDVSFRLVVGNGGAKLINLGALLKKGKLESLRSDGFVYYGQVHVANVVLPPGYWVEGSGQVEVPTNALPEHKVSFRVITPSGPVAIPYASHYPPEPTLPTSRLDQSGQGATISLPLVADLTLTGQAVGPFYSFGNISSNWALTARWTNEGGQDAALHAVIRVMEGKRIFDVAITSTSIAPLTDGTAVLHLPMLGAGNHFLVVSDPAGAHYGLYRVAPTVPAQTWQVSAHLVPTNGDLWSARFVSPRQGWAVGGNGAILHTTNGGISWEPQQSGTTNSLYAASFTSPTDGWVVGSHGTLLNTADGGNTWTPVTTSTSHYLSGLAFLGTDKGWLVGEGGTIKFTTDGGLNWSDKSGGTADSLVTTALASIAYPDHNNLWAVGAGGAILHTANAGISLVGQASGTSADLNSVFFLDSKAGWIVGKGGAILSTKNGGANWIAHPGITNLDLNAVHFQDARDGWIVGDQGLILHTVDGGSHWTTLASGTANYLIGISFSDPRNGWVTGQNGTLLHLGPPTAGPEPGSVGGMPVQGE